MLPLASRQDLPVPVAGGDDREEVGVGRLHHVGDFALPSQSLAHARSQGQPQGPVQGRLPQVEVHQHGPPLGRANPIANCVASQVLPLPAMALVTSTTRDWSHSAFRSNLATTP